MSLRSNANGRILLGVLLILIGGMLFLKNIHLNLLFIDVFSWPFILLVIGIVVLVNDNDSFLGIVLVLVGGAGIASRYFHVSFYDILYDYWPFILIIFGVFIVLKTFVGKSESGPEVIEADEYYVDAFKIFGEEDKFIKTKNFQGGKLTTIFGELRIVLRDCEIRNSHIELDNLTVFGSTVINIPSDWDVIVKATTVFGGLDDDRREQVSVDNSEKKVLVIKGLILFGGVSIKN